MRYWRIWGRLSAVVFPLIIFFVGCDGDSDVAYRVPESALRLDNTEFRMGETNGVLRTIASLSTNDILVVVNGNVLSKGVYEELMSLYLKNILEQKDMNAHVAGKMLEEHRSNYPRNFMGQRLLVDYGFREKIVTTNEVLEAITKRVREMARQKKMPITRFLAAHEKNGHYFLYELCAAYVMNAVIKARIPPKAIVDKDFIEAVRQEVRRENAASQTSNAVLRTQMEGIRHRLVDKHEDFATIGTELEATHVAEFGTWENYTADDFDNPLHAGAVFSLKNGGVSEILEEDDGFRLVKVDKILSEEHSMDGQVLNPERRQLSYIYVEKRPLLIEEGDVVLAQDLKRQMQMQAINSFITNLSTNGQNTIFFPSGAISF